MVEKLQILVLPGDGIGPEVTASGLAVLEAALSGEPFSINLEEDLLHGAAWDVHGTFCRDETVDKARAADAVLVGSVGGPKWDGIKVPGGAEMQDGLMRLRKELDTYAGLRPARAIDCLLDHVPYRPEIAGNSDILVLREMCGGAFFREPRGISLQADGSRLGLDTAAYDSNELARIAHAAFKLARRRRGVLASADKANVMESCVLWREVFSRIAPEYPDVELTHYYADNAVYQLARNPRAFDVIVGDNLFGDILSDQAGAIAGSLGMLPSGCLPGIPDQGGRISGIYEPVHGSAPDIAGRGIANPIGMILSVAMMLNYSFGRPDLADKVDQAVESALNKGVRTPDLGGTDGTETITQAVLAEL